MNIPLLKLGVKQQRKREVIAEEGSSELKERLKSLTLPHSGDWLKVVPCTAIRLHLHPQEFVIMTRYRYGCPSCRHDTDVQGNHAIYCTSGGCNGDV